MQLKLQVMNLSTESHLKDYILNKFKKKLCHRFSSITFVGNVKYFMVFSLWTNDVFQSLIAKILARFYRSAKIYQYSEILSR